MKTMRYVSGLVLGGALMLGAAATDATAQTASKLWQLTSGTLTLEKTFLVANHASRGKMITVPVAMYVIEHPRGLVVYDTGMADDVSDGGCDAYWGKGLCSAFPPKQRRDEVIDQQLKKLGYSTDQVKYVIYSHFHLDHAGNIELFPKARHVVQKAEIRHAWWPEKWYAGAFILKDYDETRKFNFLELTGDYDLFDDGAITILSTRGHTPGHQSLKVRLAKTGTLVLTGDAIYTPENAAGVPPGLTVSLEHSMGSIERLKNIRDGSGGELWYSHNMDQYNSHKHDKPYE